MKVSRKKLQSFFRPIFQQQSLDFPWHVEWFSDDVYLKKKNRISKCSAVAGYKTKEMLNVNLGMQSSATILRNAPGFSRNLIPFPQKKNKLCIKYIGKFFLIEKIIFNIVEGNLFPGTY
jgi:hypothetical protein